MKIKSKNNKDKELAQIKLSKPRIELILKETRLGQSLFQSWLLSLRKANYFRTKQWEIGEEVWFCVFHVPSYFCQGVVSGYEKKLSVFSFQDLSLTVRQSWRIHFHAKTSLKILA
jgi:hypothetical protein